MKKDLLSLFVFLWFTTLATAQCFNNGWSHPKIQGNALRCVYVLGSTAYAGGDEGTVLKTIDGGVSWSPVNINTTDRISGIHFTDINTGYAVGFRSIYKTTDGGISWQASQIFSNPILLDV